MSFEGKGRRKEEGTFICDTSESAVTLPSFLWETWDSALRRSSRVVWKVDSDMAGSGRFLSFLKLWIWLSVWVRKYECFLNGRDVLLGKMRVFLSFELKRV